MALGKKVESVGKKGENLGGKGAQQCEEKKVTVEIIGKRG
jgi:hypothetical protein